MAVYTGPPRTWAAAEKVTAALLNSEFRDAIGALSGAWNSYTPSLSGFTQGNGLTSGRYIQVGKYVSFQAVFTFGSTSAAATAAPILSLPTASAYYPRLFNAMFFDSSASTAHVAQAANIGSYTNVTIYALSGSAYASCSTTVPFTWAVDDAIHLSGVYEAA